MAEPELKPVSISQYKRLLDDGWAVYSGDAGKSCSDYFLFLSRQRGEKSEDREYLIVCPTFLRGPMTVSKNGAAY